MKKKPILFLLLVFIACCAFLEGKYRLVRSVKTAPEQQLALDNLGSVYTISKDGILTKYSNQLDAAPITYTDKSLGRLGAVDVSNPLKVLLLYPDYGQVNFLDNKLSPTGIMNLRDIGIIQPTLLCSSYDNCIWVYDQQDFQLKRIDQNLTITNQSGNIPQVVGHDIYPASLTAYNNWIFMVDTTTGILQFDMYGTYYKTIYAKNVRSMQIIDNQLLYLQQGRDSVNLYSYNTKNAMLQPILLPSYSKNIKEARIFGQNLFLLHEEALELYAY